MELSDMTEAQLAAERERRTLALNDVLQETRRRADAAVSTVLRECFAKLEEGL